MVQARRADSFLSYSTCYAPLRDGETLHASGRVLEPTLRKTHSDQRLRKSITRRVMSSSCPFPFVCSDQPVNLSSNESANLSDLRPWLESKKPFKRSAPNSCFDGLLVSSTPSV